MSTYSKDKDRLLTKFQEQMKERNVVLGFAVFTSDFENQNYSETHYAVNANGEEFFCGHYTTYQKCFGKKRELLEKGKTIPDNAEYIGIYRAK